MSEALSTALNSLGLSGAQQSRLAGLQEAGRKIDFVYHYTDDGRGSRQAANQFDEFHAKLKVFSDEGETPRRFAAALWDHLAPRFVGWRPEFIEGVEARELGGVLIRLDHDIDVRLGRAIPPDVRPISQDVRSRFDDLLFAYETGTWRDSRTPGEVRDELVFVASFDEKIRNVLYGSARQVDLRRVTEDYSPAREVAEQTVPDSAFEARAYGAQLAKISDLVERLRVAGVPVQAGLTFKAASERLPQARPDDLTTVRAHAASERKTGLSKRQQPSDADQYWRDVAQSASLSTGIGRTERLLKTRGAAVQYRRVNAMSEIDADLDRAAAAYWLSIANKGGFGKVAALTRAADLLRDARAETRIPDSAKQPTLNDLEAPPLDMPRGRRLTR